MNLVILALERKAELADVAISAARRTMAHGIFVIARRGVSRHIPSIVVASAL